VSGDSIDRSAAGLRDALFGVLENLRDNKIDHQQARAAANVAQQIIKSAEVQMEFEVKKLESQLPQHLGEMRLTPPLKDTPRG